MGTKAKLKQFWGFLLAAVMVCTVVVVPPKTTFAVTNADMPSIADCADKTYRILDGELFTGEVGGGGHVR